MRKGLKLCLAVVASVSLSLAARAADDAGNPFKAAKVGDWAKYKQNVSAGGMKAEAEMKQTVVAKTAQEATLEIEMSLHGAPPIKSRITIQLDQKYEPYRQPGMKDMEVKELGKGEEKLAAGGKSLDTKWVEVEVLNKAEGAATKMKYKVWSSASVPCGGMVKMEGEMPGNGKVSMELLDFGNGK